MSGAGPARDDARAALVAACALAGICGLAFAVRSLGLEGVFVGGGEVVLAVGDGLYHAGSALYTLRHFPAVITIDPYLGYPSGSSVPAPLTPDLVAAFVARLLGGEPVLEHVLAWSSPVYGALAPLAVYAAARTLAGRAASLGAALLFALLPIVVGVSRVGDPDHHALVTGLGAAALATTLALAGPAPGRIWLAALGLGLAKLALLLSWSGSLLYLGLADGSLLLVASLARRGELFGAIAWSAAGAGLGALPYLWMMPDPPGGPWSTLDLSRLHLCFELGVGLLAASGWALARLRPAPSAAASLLRMAGIGAALAGAFLLVPGLWQGILPGVGFVGSAEAGRQVTAELMPLFPLPGRPALQPASNYFGALAYLVPFAPLAGLLAARRRGLRARGLVLAGWTALLAVLTLWQARFGADFAAGGAVAFALLLGFAGRRLARLGLPSTLRVALGVAAVIGALQGPLRHAVLPAARSTWAALRGESEAGDGALRTPAGSLKRFLEEVRAVTPETTGAFSGDEPGYGVLCPARIGHPVRYWARRAPNADGMLQVVAPEHFARARRFFEVHDEAEGLALAEALRARYVVTMYFPGNRPGTLGGVLQNGDGVTEGGGLGHFRLVTEGPRGGRPLSDLFGFPRPARVVPYKLFEIVPGALLEVAAAPGTRVSAELSLRSPIGRNVVWHTQASAGPDGTARLRVPYATEARTPMKPLGPYRIRAGALELRAAVTEEDVLGGGSVRVPGVAPAPGS